MKKTLILLAILSSFGAISQKHLIGIKGGPNWTGVHTDNFSFNTKLRTGYLVGLTYDYMLTEKFSIGAEILYGQRGYNMFFNSTNDFGLPPPLNIDDVKMKFDYLSIPIKASYSFGNKLFGFGSIGVIPSFLTKGVTVTPPISLFSYSTNGSNIEITEDVSRFDLAAFAEIGVGYRFNDTYLIYLSFGYNHSFLTITNDDYFSESKIRHYGMPLMLGFKYAL